MLHINSFFVILPVMDCSSNIPNSHYEVCGTDCGHTCASSIDASCEHTCSEGCFCDEGFVRSGGLCVPVEQCGCLYDGFYYHVRIKTSCFYVKPYYIGQWIRGSIALGYYGSIHHLKLTKKLVVPWYREGIIIILACTFTPKNYMVIT